MTDTSGWWAETFLAPTGIPSGEAFGVPTVFLGGPRITPIGIPSAEAFGVPKITMFLAPTGIPSAEAFGAPRASQIIAPTGIGSSEAFGAATITKPVTFDATAFGTAGNVPFGTSTAGWNQNIAVGAKIALVVFHRYSDNTVTVLGASCGGQPMTLLPGSSVSPGFARTIEVYYIQNPATGPNVPFTASVGGFGNNIVLGAHSLTYTNIISVGTGETTIGSGTQVSQSISNMLGKKLLHCFTTEQGGVFTGYNQTQRVNNSSTAVLVGDADGAAGSLTFTATIPSSPWASIIVSLIS